MTNVMYLQQAYIDLYTYLRNYIWGFNVVEQIANLEVSVFRACPDVNDIKINLEKLHSLIYPYLREDEEFNDCYETFQELLDETENTYMKLKAVNEVI